jgi:hypothetical protein
MKSHTLPIAMTLMIGVFNCAYAQEAVKSPIPQVSAECSDFGPNSASTVVAPSSASAASSASASNTTTNTRPSANPSSGNEPSANSPVKIERTGIDKASIHLQILQQTSNHLSETNTKKVSAEEKKSAFKTERTEKMEEPGVQE